MAKLVELDQNPQSDLHASKSAPDTGLRGRAKLTLSGLALPTSALITAPMLARALGPHDRGSLSAVLAPLVLAPLLGLVGLSDAAAFLVARGFGQRHRVLLVLGGLSLIFAVLTWSALFKASASLFRENETARVFVALLPSLPFSFFLLVLRGIRMGEGRYDRVAIEKLVAGFVRLALFTGLWACGRLTLTSAACSHIIALLAGAATLGVETRTTPPEYEGKSLAAILANGSRYGLGTWLGEIGRTIANRADQILIIPLAGSTQLGYYVVAVALAEVPQALFSEARLTLIADAVCPEQAAHTICATARRAVGTLVVTCAAIAVVSPVAIYVLFGPAFLAAAPMGFVLLVATVISGLSVVATAGLSAINKPGLGSLAHTCGGLVMLALGVPLISALGGLGAAIASLAAYSTVLSLATALLHGRLKFSVSDFIFPRLSDIHRPIVAFIRIVSRCRKMGRNRGKHQFA